MVVQRFYVSRKSHGSLIGKGGSILKGIESSCSVQIKFPPKEDTISSWVEVQGTQEAINKCRAEFESILGFKVADSPLEQANLQNIPSNKYGAIIGKGGSTLKELQAKYGVTIQIPDGDGKPVFVEGPSKSIDALAADLSNLLKVSVKAEHLAAEKQTTFDLKKSHSGVLFFPDVDDIEKPSPNFNTFLQYLRSANKTCDVAVYTLSDSAIAQTLGELHRRGVKVRIITDNDTMKDPGSLINYVKDLGIPVKVDKSPFHMHHKFSVLDKLVVMSGSFNYSTQARKSNNENVVVSSSQKFVSVYSSHFDKMWNDGTNFESSK